LREIGKSKTFNYLAKQYSRYWNEYLKNLKDKKNFSEVSKDLLRNDKRMIEFKKIKNLALNSDSLSLAFNSKPNSDKLKLLYQSKKLMEGKCDLIEILEDDCHESFHFLTLAAHF
jgi:hypothetical protein